MARDKNGLGKAIWMEWVDLLIGHSKSVRRNEKMFDIGLPLLVALAAGMLYWKAGKVTPALDAMAELLPSVVPTLIGFTVLFITLILSTDTPAIKKLKEKDSEAKWGNGKKMSVFQVLYIQLTESLFSEVTLLLLVMAYLFYSGLWKIAWLELVILAAEVYLTLHILLGIIRSMTNLYFTFISDGNNTK